MDRELDEFEKDLKRRIEELENRYVSFLEWTQRIVQLEIRANETRQLMKLGNMAKEESDDRLTWVLKKLIR